MCPFHSPSRSGTTHLTVGTILQGEQEEKETGADPADRRQLRRSDRPQFRRARRREQRPVRRGHRHRLFLVWRANIQATRWSFITPSVGHWCRPTSRWWRVAEQRLEADSKSSWLRMSTGRPATAVRPNQSPADPALRQLAARCRPATPIRRRNPSVPRCSLTRMSQRPLPGGGEPVRPDGDLPPEKTHRPPPRPSTMPNANVKGQAERAGGGHIKQARSFAYSPLVSDSMNEEPSSSWSCSAKTRKSRRWPSSSPGWKDL